MDETELLRRASRVLDAWNTGDMGAVDEVISPALIDHGTGPNTGSGGAEAVKAFIAGIRAGLPDLDSTVVHEAAREDVAMQHLVVTGTHTGPMFGLPGTGSPVRFELANIDRFEDGLIVEHWSVLDTADLMRQLGAVAPGVVPR